MECGFLKDCEVRIPLLETRAMLQANVLSIGGETFRIKDWVRYIGLQIDKLDLGIE